MLDLSNITIALDQSHLYIVEIIKVMVDQSHVNIVEFTR